MAEIRSTDSGPSVTPGRVEQQPAQKRRGSVGKGLGLLAGGVAIGVGATLLVDYTQDESAAMSCTVKEAGIEAGRPFIRLQVQEGGRAIEVDPNSPPSALSAELHSYYGREQGVPVPTVPLEPHFDDDGGGSTADFTARFDRMQIGETVGSVVAKGLDNTDLFVYVTQVREKSGTTVVREETVACGAVMRWVDNPEQGNQFNMIDQQLY